MDAERTSRVRRSHAVILALVVAFIIYGSLYPFRYYDPALPGGPLGHFLTTWRDWDGRGDLLSNILLYMPLGFFATSALSERVPMVVRVLLAVLVGTLLSASMELTQFHDRGRVSTLGDLYANAIGSAVGAVGAMVLAVARRWDPVAVLARDPVAVCVLAAWLAYRLYPYVPLIDLHKYWHALWPVIRAPQMDPLDLVRFALIWLMVGAIAETLYGRRGGLVFLVLVAGGETLGQIMIIGRALKPADLAGIAIALAVQATRLPVRRLVLAAAFALLVATLRLVPFRFAAISHGFGWVPFLSFMSGSIGVDIQSFCEKAALYGGLIWLLDRAGLRLAVAAGATALMLLATSFAESFEAGRSAEIGDALLALLLGLLFALLRSGPAQAREAGRPAQAG
ncbi:MAG: VanZ family protein [Rhodospirillales bacterium]|nr:VanZ family protein [Rhodospirillales bacterium]